MWKIIILLLILCGSLAACDTIANPLPHALYYLAAPTDEDPQVWRLDADGVTTTQITHQAAGVDGFSVSPADGSLALISDNHLYLVDAEGKDRRLIADDSKVDKQTEDYAHRGTDQFARLLPDGRTR
jgi:hypothetical protein